MVWRLAAGRPGRLQPVARAAAGSLVDLVDLVLCSKRHPLDELDESDESDESDEPLPIICVFDSDFHEGVVCVVASRIKDKLHRPTFIFAASQALGKEHEPKDSVRSRAQYVPFCGWGSKACRPIAPVRRSGSQPACTWEQLPSFTAWLQPEHAGALPILRGRWVGPWEMMDPDEANSKDFSIEFLAFTRNTHQNTPAACACSSAW